eukprot:gene9328-1415_t
MSKEEIEKYKQLFKEFDLDGNGYLDKEELAKGTKKMGLSFTDEMIDNMIESADKNKDGKIQLDEFLEIMLGN